MGKYRIFKDRKTGSWQIMWFEGGRYVHITAKRSWKDAIYDVNFLINADRGLNRMVNASFN